VSGLRESSMADPGGEAGQAAESGERQDPAAGPEARPSRRARIGEWFRALLRSVVALVATLAVLAVLGGVTDVVLHVTRHTSRNTSTYSSIDGVVVVLDGNVSLSVVGRTQGGQGASLTAVDTSTPFDDPIRTADVIGGTLYLTERCPDSRCSADLTLTVDTNDTVSVSAGNAVDLAQAVVEFDGIDGQASVLGVPATLVAIHTIVTGAVMGQIKCDTAVDCRDVAMPGSS
jgi:hypothetical protein